MKYLKSYTLNEGLTRELEDLYRDPDISFHMEYIKDLFQEVIDEFCLDRYFAHDNEFQMLDGRYYDILLYYGGGGKISENSLRVAIKLVGIDNRELFYTIKNSTVVSDFTSRLESIGYKVNKITYKDDYDLLLYEITLPAKVF